MKNLKKVILKAAALAIAILPMMTSCYDDSSIWDKFDDIEHRLDSLENSLNEQFQALNSLIDGKTTITSCETNKDGSYAITLSNGVKFTALHEGADCSSLVSVIDVKGIKCWATYDANGNLIALTDDANEPIPVINDYRANVEVLVEDGIYYLVIDGKKYMTGYDTEDIVQVFSSCTPLKDASGNIYAMTFTFGEGLKVTVAVDGYNGIIFKLPGIQGSNTVVSEYFISYEDTQSLLVTMSGVVDYVMQIPDGWRVEERLDTYNEDIYIDITAPSAEAIKAGAAVISGHLKVVSVLHGGKAAVSKVSLSADPFKVFDISGSKAVIEPYEGVQKFVYGLTKLEEYDEASLLQTVSSLLKSSGDAPKGFGIAEDAVSVLHSETLGSKLENTSYVFWAIPAMYSEGEDGGFYVKEGMFHTHEITGVSVEISNPVEYLYDADITVGISGADMIYAGTSLKSDRLIEDIVYQINNGIIEPFPAQELYEGPASEFPTKEANRYVDFLPANDYVTWVVAVEDGKTTYTANDVYYKEFRTKNIVPGSSLTATLGEPAVTRSEIEVSIEAEGADLICYAFLPKTDGERISTLDNDTKAEFILDRDDCVYVKGSEATAYIEKVKPNTTMWLYALPVSKDGKHGEVSNIKATTEKMEYNDLTISVNATEIGANNAVFQIDVTGGEATEFIYWIGKRIDPFWANESYLGGTKNNAQQYMALYPEDENIAKCMSKYGPVSDEGTLSVDNLTMNTEYIIMVLAKDASGLYSKGGYKMITTLSANLGNIVRTGSEQWNAAKEQVNIDWIESMFKKSGNSNMFSDYALNFSCPSDYTAYVICGNKDYYEDPQFFTAIEDVMIDIEKYASRRYDSPIITYDSNGELMSEPDWYDNNGKKNPGTLMNVCEFNVHGVPGRGFVTYFASTHDEGNCPAWEAGSCPNYTRAQKMIEERCSLEYWKEKFRSMGITNEESLTKNAQAYLEAYKPYYEGKEPILFVNTGEPLVISCHEATGPNDAGEVEDDVIVMLKDAAGNYFEPMYFQVPNLFK